MFHMNKKTKQILAAIIVIILIAAMVLPMALSVNAAETSAAEDASEAQTEAASSSNEAESSDTVQKGITLEGEDVSGLTRDELTAKAQEIADKMRNATVTIHGREDDQKVTVSAGNLGMTWSNTDVVDQIMDYGRACNIIARYKQEKDLAHDGAAFTIKTDFSKDKILAFIKNNCEAFNQEAQNASLKRENGAFTIVGGQTGYVVDEDASADKIYTALTTDWNGSDVDLDLDVEEQQPKGSTEELSKVKDLLGTFTTYYSTSNASRKQNIANGCSLINGTTLYPGEEFSVLQHITPFTEENGYALAGSYLGDEVVESFGGGICQVSTTLYNAVIRAELKVTARSNHSMIVGYVDPSEDAAIAESSGMDLKFVNNLRDPIYIAGYADGGQITFNIYGVETRDAGRKVSFESETLTTTPSEGTKVKTDASQPVGYVSETAGHTGYTAQLWKIVTENGKQVSREVFNKSTYQMTPEIVTVGTAGTVTSELQAAIESGDVSAIRTAAANAKNAASSAGTSAADAAAAAQKAAQDAYAAALAAGQDTNSAMEAAQAAANAAVAQSTGSASASSTDSSAAASQADSSAAASSADGSADAESASADSSAAASSADGSADAAGAASQTDGSAAAQEQTDGNAASNG
jgi:vancomycin resistance protein YoaR